jgi:hypothetical protein
MSSVVRSSIELISDHPVLGRVCGRLRRRGGSGTGFHINPVIPAAYSSGTVRALSHKTRPSSGEVSNSKCSMRTR